MSVFSIFIEIVSLHWWIHKIILAEIELNGSLRLNGSLLFQLLSLLFYHSHHTADKILHHQDDIKIFLPQNRCVHFSFYHERYAGHIHKYLSSHFMEEEQFILIWIYHFRVIFFHRFEPFQDHLYISLFFFLQKTDSVLYLAKVQVYFLFIAKPLVESFSHYLKSLFVYSSEICG